MSTTTKPRRMFELAFKLQVIDMVRTQGLSIAQVCRDMRLPRSVLARCTSSMKNKRCALVRGALSAEQRRIRELKSQVRSLQLGRGILKKASAFSGRELR